MHAVNQNDQKGWSQNQPPPRRHLRAGSGGEGILLEISVYVRSSEGEQLFFPLVLQLLHLGLFSLVVAWDSATPLSLLYFPSHCGVIPCNSGMYLL